MPHNIMSAAQLAQTRYDVPNSDVGAMFAVNRYQGQADTPPPLTSGTITTAGRAMAWKNLNPGAAPGTYQNFGDSGNAPMPPAALGA